RYIYKSNDPADSTGLLEITFEKVIKAEEAAKKVERAARRGLLRRFHGIDWIADATSKNILTQREADLLRDANTFTARVIAVDDFDPDEIRPNYMLSGHNVRIARESVTE